MDFFPESIIQYIDSLDKYPFGKGYAYIYEALKSHDVQKLKSKIEKEFSDDIIDISIENKEGQYGTLYVKFHNNYLGSILGKSSNYLRS